MAGKAGIDPPRGRMGQQAEPAERALALQAARDVVRERDHLEGRGQHELTRVQDERLVSVRLDFAGQVRLLNRRVDVRVAVVLEYAEIAVEPDIHAGRLEELGGERIEGN